MKPIAIPKGASAQSIAAHLCGIGQQTGAYPHDADDFGRCEAFLTEQPQLRAEMYRMAEVNAYWAALVLFWREIGHADPGARSNAIRSIVANIAARDPGHVQIGPDLSARIGPNTFEAIKSAHEAHRKAAGKPPMKPDPQFDAASNNAYAVTADELRQFIERYEQLAVEKADIAAQMAEVMAEAKGRGYATKIIRQIIALRKRKPDDVAEEQAVLDVYKAALGMDV